ncbi:hypothetical protein DQ04_01241130 [Trypanosoma grayi]|uniref:hypothetical protein n=1 Tax=Trypanosoma grayi TaxID=71804 RepID=UPI0004F42E7A|nr:hypothetical protein DQ04_01241130 [Trypanosoma grayi]KEG13058.1 hypothetical protein DQ04_01241130 [Trypanosoma grayi]
MEDELRLRKKRAIVEEGDRDEEQLDNTPKYADAATMAQRRIVRVRRDPPSSAAAPSLAGAFKAVTGITPTGAPTLATKFGLGSDSNTTNSDTGGGGTSSSAITTAAAPSFSSGFNSALTGSTAPVKFSFGINNNEKKNDTETKKEENDSNDNNESSIGGAKTSLFGGAFNFAGVVNSFAEAKERMAKAEDGVQETSTPPESNTTTTTATSDAFANAAPLIPSTGTVLASAPAKLFVFKLETKTWVECGAGDARVKQHVSPNANDKATKNAYRLILRDGYDLNAVLCANFHVTKAEDTHLIFAMPVGDKVSTYLLKYTGPQAAARGAEFTKTLKETLKLAQDDSP